MIDNKIELLDVIQINDNFKIILSNIKETMMSFIATNKHLDYINEIIIKFNNYLNKIHTDFEYDTTQIAVEMDLEFNSLKNDFNSLYTKVETVKNILTIEHIMINQIYKISTSLIDLNFDIDVLSEEIKKVSNSFSRKTFDTLNPTNNELINNIIFDIYFYNLLQKSETMKELKEYYNDLYMYRIFINKEQYRFYLTLEDVIKRGPDIQKLVLTPFYIIVGIIAVVILLITFVFLK
ncbi:MAG: hypothetical protein ACRC5M_06070 [Anaeroplasmataceae bacterium]